jgi:general secretion pathway protein M
MTRIGIIARVGAWWRQRSRRERALIGVTAAAVSAYLLATNAVEPMLAARAQARAAIAGHDAALARLAARPASDAALASRSGRSVTAAVTESAPAYDLAIRRIEAVADGARLEVEDAGFAEVILWIEELEGEQALRVTAVEMDRRPEPGVVSARLTVTR